MINTPGFIVTTHESDTGEVRAVFLDKVIDSFRTQWYTLILPKVMTMTTRAVTRAIRDIDCQCHFVGYLLKYYSGIDVFQHSALVCHGIVAAGCLLLTSL